MSKLFEEIEKIVCNLNTEEIKELTDYTIKKFGDLLIKHPV
ncbi:hypothetical protein [Wukongibacter sp. M2B1]